MTTLYMLMHAYLGNSVSCNLPIDARLNLHCCTGVLSLLKESSLGSCPVWMCFFCGDIGTSTHYVISTR